MSATSTVNLTFRGASRISPTRQDKQAAIMPETLTLFYMRGLKTVILHLMFPEQYSFSFVLKISHLANLTL